MSNRRLVSNPAVKSVTVATSSSTNRSGDSMSTGTITMVVISGFAEDSVESASPSL